MLPWLLQENKRTSKADENIYDHSDQAINKHLCSAFEVTSIVQGQVRHDPSTKHYFWSSKWWVTQSKYNMLNQR